MDRHITDHGRDRSESAKLRAFLRLDREAGRHPAARALYEKPREARSGAATREYARIERGEDA